MHQGSILSNKRVICRLAITPTHKMVPHVVKDSAPMWTQDGHHKMASREGLLGGTRPEGRAVGGDQACRGGQLEVTWQAEEGSWE